MRRKTSRRKTCRRKHLEEKHEEKQRRKRRRAFKEANNNTRKHLFNDSVLKEVSSEEVSSEEVSSEETFSTNLTDITSTENEDISPPKVSEDINDSKKEAKDQLLVSEENNALKKFVSTTIDDKDVYFKSKTQENQKRSTPSVKAEIQEVSLLEETQRSQI